MDTKDPQSDFSKEVECNIRKTKLLVCIFQVETVWQTFYFLK